MGVQKRTNHKSLRQFSMQLCFYINAFIHCESPKYIISSDTNIYDSMSDHFLSNTKTVEFQKFTIHNGCQRTLTSGLNFDNVTSPVDIRALSKNGTSKFSSYGTNAKAIQFKSWTLVLKVRHELTI